MFQSLSPKLCEILQARLKDRRGALNSSRASVRALHLEPEFKQKNPHNNPDTVEHSMELQYFLETEEREEKVQNQTTPTVQESTGHTNTEVERISHTHKNRLALYETETHTRPGVPVYIMFFSAAPSQFSFGIPALDIHRPLLIFTPLENMREEGFIVEPFDL